MRLQLLTNRNYACYTLGQGISLFGNVILTVALSLYVLRLTGSVQQFAQVWMISAVPHVLIGPLAGVWVDRLPAKPLLIGCDLLRGAYLWFACYLAFTGHCSLVFLHTSMFLFAVVAVLFRSSCATLLPSILSRKDLVDGNALRQFIAQVSEMAAPALSAALYHWYGMTVIFGIAATTFLISGIAKMGLHLPPRRRRRLATSFWSELGHGFRLIVSNPSLGSLVLNSSLTQCFLTPFFTIGTLHILIHVMHVPDSYVGLVRSIAVVGSLLPIVCIGWAQRRFSLAWNVTMSLGGVLIATALLFLLLPQPIHTVLSGHPFGATSLFSGIRLSFEMMVGLYGVFVATYYQLHVPGQDLGKYSSILRMACRLGQIGGLWMYGYLFERRPLWVAFLCLLLGLVLKGVAHLPFYVAHRPHRALPPATPTIDEAA